MITPKKVVLLLAALLVGAPYAPAQVVVSEIHYHPVEEPAFNADGTPAVDLTDDVYEFVEIQNTGVSAVSLAGWTLAGGIAYTFPTGTVVTAGGYRIIAKNPALLAAAYSLTSSTVLGPYTGLLGNKSDTVRLRDAADDTVDVVAYDSRFPWAQSADGLGAQDRFTGLSSANFQYKGRSLQRVSVTWPSSDPANWLASPLSPGPTPGAAQAVTRTVPKPVVVAFSAAQTGDGATVVRAGQAVTVSCTFSATNALSEVQVEYFVDDMNSTAETRTSVTMTALGAGKFTASLPGQTDRSIVRYRFKANRGDGAEAVSPRADDPQIAPIGASGAREAWHGYFVTPSRTSTNPIYDVFVSTASLTTLNSNITQSPVRVTAATAAGLPRSIPYVAATAPQWDGTQPGVFACNGEVWDVQIRYHGSRYHRAASNNSFKLHFPENHPFDDQSAWFITGHGQEFVEAQQLNRLLGLPASKMFWVDWYYNSNAMIARTQQGEYGNEMLDAYHKLQQQLNPGTGREGRGELYKDVGNRDSSQNNVEGPYTCGDSAPMLANASWTQLQRYEWTYSPQANTWKGPKPVRDLIEGMWTARGDTISTHSFSSTPALLASAKSWFSNNWDVETLVTSMALLEWMSIWDDAKQNHFFWHRANGKWCRLGWDYDQVMATTGGGMGGGSSQTIYGGEYGATTVFDGVNWWKDTFYKCLRTEYHKRLWELNNSFLDPANLTAYGLTRAATFASARQTYVNTQLSSLGTYYKPARPSNASPATGAAIVGSASLTTSAYSHPQSTAHAATIWEIRAAAGSYEEPLMRLKSTVNLTALPVPFDQLTYGQTYYWHVTHVDASGHPSIVSAETGFTWGSSSTSAGTLVLNEVLAYNRNTVQSGSDFPDYIELRNNGATTLTLTGYTLTDDPLVPARYAFPAGTAIAAGGYLVVWGDSDTNSAGLHAGFGVNSDGDQVLLLHGATLVDSVTFGPQGPDLSIGRIADGTGGWQANKPTPGLANSARTLGAVSSLRINEWMANPVYGDDWLELYNPATNPVALTGLYLSDTPSDPTVTQIPALSFIAARGYTRFLADGKNDGDNHANFKLSASGESLVLTAANGATTLDTVTFSGQPADVAQGRLPDGAATFAGFAQTASPGFPNWLPAAVYINEVLAHAYAPFEDAIELYNPTAGAVSVGGWWLSDDTFNRQKYQLPAGATVPARGYLVVYEGSFGAGAVPFALNAWGDEIALSAVDGSGALTGYGSFVRFGPRPRNQPFGRVEATGLEPDAGGAEFWPETTCTFGVDSPADEAAFRAGPGATNAAPLIGPLVINEILYHPPDTNGSDNEFIELHNVSAAAVDLAGWRLRGDSDYEFPDGASLAAGGYALVASFSPTNAAALAAFRAAYSLGAEIAVYGPYSPELANGTHSLELARPDVLDEQAVWFLVDKVKYRDVAPWPLSPDGTGDSLQRTSLTLIGNTAANWAGAAPTPGAVNAGVLVGLGITTASPLPGGVVGAAYETALSAAGGSLPYSWNMSTGTVPGLVLSAAGVLGGTPETAGAFAFTAHVEDSAGAAASKAFAMTIAATALGITTASPLPDGAVAASYSQALAAEGGTPPYAWAVSAGAIPTGLNLSSAGALSGTPTAAGTFLFTARVTDAGGLAAIREFSVTVPVPPLTITCLSPLPDAELGTPYAQALTAVGGLTPYAWTVTDGALPAGLALSGSGDLSGAPAALGTFAFTARLADAASNAVTKALELTVVPPPLVITSDVLADGIVGTPYSELFTASGGVPPRTWSVSAGALPPGLTLDASGALDGTPTAAGSFSFTVKVEDSLGAATLIARTLVIDASGPLAGFTWDYVPASAYAGTPFGVRLTARDAESRIVAALNDDVAVSAASGSGSLTSPIVVTEITDGNEDQFELQNVTSAAVDTAGWFVRIGDSLTDINTLNAITFYLPASMAAGGLLRVSELNLAGRTYWGALINWSSSAGANVKGWVMLFDSSYRLRDFVPIGWTAAQQAALSIEVNGTAVTTAGNWSGVPLTPGTRGSNQTTYDSWQRIGTNDANTSTNWVWRHNTDNTDATSFGVQNTGLTTPWATTTPVALTPTAVALAAGQFVGYLTITQAITGVRLTAADGASHTGVSGLVNVAAAADADHDGMADAWENSHGLSVGTDDGEADDDDDGASNREEYLAGTDPKSGASLFELIGSDLSAPGRGAIQWKGVVGRLYRFGTSSDMATWTPGTAWTLVTAEGTQTTTLDLNGASPCFVRVEIAPAP